MTYTPKTWVTGETITADDLNLITPLVEPLIFGEDNSMSTYHEAGYIYTELSKGRLGSLYAYLEETGFIVFEYMLSCVLAEGVYSLYTVVYDVSTGAPSINMYTADSESAHFVPFIDNSN